VGRYPWDGTSHFGRQGCPAGVPATSAGLLLQAAYAYDRFGRMTKDGGLTYDENDNRTK